MCIITSIPGQPCFPKFTFISLHGRGGEGVGHLGDDEALEAGGREFDPRPGRYSRINF